ncbi:MAG: hypothetical protein V4562_10600 [Pseudomonadota bacterium]
MHTLHLAGWSPAAPLRNLMGWLSGSLAAPTLAVATPARSASLAPVCVAKPRLVERRSRPLRVLRVLDGGPQERSAAGRMVISGRFADVCEELDRMAALEAAESNRRAC